MNFLISFLKGICLGIASIAPGVSGGSIAVVFGLYERITNVIANILKDIKGVIRDHFLFFLPIALGGAVGFLGFSRLMEYLFQSYDAQMKYLFLGLIVGTLPLIFRQANEKGFRPVYLIPFFAALLGTGAITLLSGAVHQSAGADAGLPTLLLYGAVLGFGTIIPGVSSSAILMYLGSYEFVLFSISHLNITALIPMGIGFGVCVVLFAKLISLLFRKAYGYTFYAINGFVISSLIPIYPGFEPTAKYALCLLLFLAGAALSFLLGRVKKA